MCATFLLVCVLHIYSKGSGNHFGTAEACRGYTNLCSVDNSNGRKLTILGFNNRSDKVQFLINLLNEISNISGGNHLLIAYRLREK